MHSLGRLKRGQGQGQGQLVARTVEATFTAVFASALLGIQNFRRRTSESGRRNPTDEVLLMANRLLVTSLVGNPIVLLPFSILHPMRMKL